MLKEAGVNVVRETMMRSYSPTQCIIVTLLHRVSSYPHKKQRTKSARVIIAADINLLFALSN